MRTSKYVQIAKFVLDDFSVRWGPFEEELHKNNIYDEKFKEYLDTADSSISEAYEIYNLMKAFKDYNDDRLVNSYFVEFMKNLNRADFSYSKALQRLIDIQYGEIKDEKYC